MDGSTLKASLHAAKQRDTPETKPVAKGAEDTEEIRPGSTAEWEIPAAILPEKEAFEEASWQRDLSEGNPGR